MPKYILLHVFLVLFGCSCDQKEILPADPSSDPSAKDRVKLLLQDYQQVLMPESVVSTSTDSTTLAMYIAPTSAYSHHILGDGLEAGALVVEIQGKRYEHTLEDKYVFEDIAPRLWDVDQDGEMEFICIRTEVSLGAGIAIYKRIGNSLREWSFLPEIGTRFRWLNPVGIADFDQNGTLDLAWIQTPHIGGVLRYASITPGEMKVIDSKAGYSNHAIGERNLCLSVLTSANDSTFVHLPSQNRETLKSLTVINQRWVEVGSQALSIDFSKPLRDQATLTSPIGIDPICVE